MGGSPTPIWDPSRCPPHRAGQPRADRHWNRGRTSGVPCAHTAAELLPTRILPVRRVCSHRVSRSECCSRSSLRSRDRNRRAQQLLHLQHRGAAGPDSPGIRASANIFFDRLRLALPLFFKLRWRFVPSFPSPRHPLPLSKQEDPEGATPPTAASPPPP